MYNNLELISTDFYNVNMSLPGGNGNPSLPTGGGNGMPTPGNGPPNFEIIPIGHTTNQHNIDSQEEQQAGQLTLVDPRMSLGYITNQERDPRMALDRILTEQNVNTEQSAQAIESIIGSYEREEVRNPDLKANRKSGHVFRFYYYTEHKFLEPEAYHRTSPDYSNRQHIRRYLDGDLMYEYHSEATEHKERYCNIYRNEPNGMVLIHGRVDPLSTMC